jgi:hypothetical protein
MTLADRFPHIPHDQSGECCGCIIPREQGATVERSATKVGRLSV